MVGLFLSLYFYSLEYKEERIEKTYLWIVATQNSNIIKNICKKMIINIIELKFNSVINKCPATRFAVNRIDNDNGRIKILIVSIIVIKGASIIGVFKGIKWIIMFFVFLYIDIIIKNNQNGNAIDIEKIICLDDEKI